jgi:diguanylate cyclase (GGDEF)-like protein
MQVLGERSTSGSTQSGAPTDSETPGRTPPTRDKAGTGRRRGARVRARTFVVRPKRARRSAWDIAALKLPDPLLTAPMSIADPAAMTLGSAPHPPTGPTGPTDPTGDDDEDNPEDDGLGDTAEMRALVVRPNDVQAIDLSDRPRLIVRPDLPVPPWPNGSLPAAAFIPAPIVPGITPAHVSPVAAPSAKSPRPGAVAPAVPDSVAVAPAVPASAAVAPAVPAPSAPAPEALAAESDFPGSVTQLVRPFALDLAADLTSDSPSHPNPTGLRSNPRSPSHVGVHTNPNSPAYTIGRNQLPDPVQLATEPSRLPEALLAAVLAVVAVVAAWGTAAPQQVWIPLATLPAVGLIALMMPGGSWARVARATALLAAAATLPVLAPALTPVTLVVALASAALYPMLVSQIAGRVVTVLAVGSLAAPLVTAALTDGPTNFFRFLLAADGDPTTAVRLALGSGILVVALIGGSTMAARRTLTRTASIAVTRERTARAATAQLGAAASCDATTGLPNREALLRALTITLADSDRQRHPSAGPAASLAAQHLRVGLVLIEIERFAQLADSLGSGIADDVAERVADRLRTGFPAPAFLARVSRHQFVLMVQDATHDSCGDLARKITVLMSAPVNSDDRDLSVTCSMGAAVAGSGLRTADDLLQAADEASRAAQRSGRSRWVMFDQAVRAHALSQATLEIELRDAIRLETIEVAFQPVLAFGTDDLDHTAGIDDRIVGAEVLARWTRSDGTTIEPRRFIPMADELGLGVVLGMQVIRQGLEALIGWRHEGVDIDQVWVNLAPSQLEDAEFAHEVAAQLAIRGLSSSSLVLEISAGELVESEQCLSTLGMLRSLGIAVALDDFGRSGTSLSALRRLPISAVKLDPSLAVELGRQDAVPRAMAQLCRTLGLRVVVEGIETMVQLRGAREIGAEAVQGFAIARPMSAEDITNLLTLRLPRDFRLR